MTVKSLLAILIGGVLVNNYAFKSFLGVTPLLGNSKCPRKCLVMGLCVTVVMLLTAAVTWPLQKFVLDKLNAGYLQTLVFTAVILLVVWLVELLAKRVCKLSLGVYFPLIALNSAVLGLAVNNVTAGYGFVEALVSALGVGLGFLVGLLVFNGVQSRINEKAVPKAFRGLPVSLLAAAIISLALFAF